MSSYILDRDLLLNPGSGTSRVTTTSMTQHLIDVNSNTALLGSVYQRSVDNETKKQITDLQDQLKMLKMDVDKKDKLIFELSSYKDYQPVKHIESSRLDAIFSVEKSTIELTKRELNTTIAKLESVSNELYEVKAKLSMKDEKINEQKREIELLKGENSNMNAMIVAQRNRMKEIEGELGGFESVASKSGITITTLQKDNKDLQQHVLELESRIKTHMHEREEAERRNEALINKLKELTSKVTTITGVSITTNVSGLDVLCTKIGDIVNENSMIKGKLMTATEKLTNVESENKANRETIQRLVHDLDKLEKDSINNKLVFDNMKAERDTALTTKTVLEKEIETLKERINSIQTAWQANKHELEKKECILNGHAANQKQIEYESLYNKNCLLAFKEQVATLLSDGFVKVDANEDQIKEKIQLLMTSSKDRGLMIATMENKIKQLADQLNEQVNIHKEMEGKYHHAESRVFELESRLKSLDSEYCATEVIRENLRTDHIKYLSFLERIGKVLKINDISADVGMDMNIDVIMARAEQLVKMEGDLIQDKQTNIYNLQRKIKSLKEQLDNKELHLDLLRKKLTSLEEERAGKCALEKEVDDHVMMSKKFKLKVEKLSEQLNLIKNENENLKAQLFDYNNIKIKLVDYEKEVSRLLNRIGELESIKDKQSVKLAKLKDDIESVNVEVNKTRNSSDGVVQSLSQELRLLKQDLERVQERERQLLDFRNVVARMLGLDMNSLAVADYEIISRIERIICSFNEGVMPVHIQPYTAIQPLHIQQVSTRVPVSTVSGTYINSQEAAAYSSSSSSASSSSAAINAHVHHHRSSSPSRREFHVHSHAHARSPSPTRNYHHYHVQQQQEQISTSKSTRSRSKSPRKVVTIDPNSY